MALGSEYSKHTLGLFRARSALDGYASPVVMSMVRPSSPGKDSKGTVIGVPFFLSEAYSQAQLSTRSGTSSSGKPSAFEKERSCSILSPMIYATFRLI